MRATFTVVDEFGQPLRIRVMPQCETPQDQARLPSSVYEFEVSRNSALLLSADLARSLCRLLAERAP